MKTRQYANSSWFPSEDRCWQKDILWLATRCNESQISKCFYFSSVQTFLMKMLLVATCPLHFKRLSHFPNVFTTQHVRSHHRNHTDKLSFIYTFISLRKMPSRDTALWVMATSFFFSPHLPPVLPQVPIYCLVDWEEEAKLAGGCLKTPDPLLNRCALVTLPTASLVTIMYWCKHMCSEFLHSYKISP